MNRNSYGYSVFLWSLVLLFCSKGIHAAVYDSIPNPAKNIQYIDPTIGNVGRLLEPTRPTMHLPNQLIRFTPQRKDYMDDQISSFPLTIVSHRLGQVFSIRPSFEELSKSAWNRKLTYDHDLEVNSPWYYSTYLIDEGGKVEFTPGRKTGIFRFYFPDGPHKSLLFDVYNDGEGQWHFISGNEMSGMETYNGDIKVYMYGVFSHTGSVGVLSDDQLQNSKEITGRGVKAYISFPAAVREVTFKYAISYISVAQARKNFVQEIRDKDFEQVSAAGKMVWSKTMSQIAVEGGTEAQKRSFFTALYRCYERMVDITEDSAYYSGFDKQVHRGDARPFYVDDWSWDTYLALHPLRMILHPAQEEDMLQSYVRMYEQSGWMPTFPVLFGDHACMNGFHSSVIFLDAWRKGLKHFDVATAYAGMRKNSVSATLLPWRNGDKTELDDYYHANGYFPALHPGEKETVERVHPFEKRQAVAITLGTSYDDWALSQLAGDLGKPEDKTRFAPGGENYRNLWNKEKSFFLPKDDKGHWIDIDPKFDGGPGGRDYYDENNGWTYLWQVQQDIPGLMGLMGGQQAFEDRLDQLFREGLDRSKSDFWYKFPDATGLVGQYSMGNEPSFHIPYLYNFTASPWKTQKRIRFLLDVWFKDNIFGIPGDEDGGGMSAFVVFSSMGFYPMTPGLPLYTIGSPVFSKVTIALSDGKHFTLIANHCSVVNKYIQSARLNGRVLNTPWFTHEQLINGGRLELEMGPRPNKEWGVGNNNKN
jgi:predicted alpha-1,2-mannosidase